MILFHENIIGFATANRPAGDFRYYVSPNIFCIFVTLISIPRMNVISLNGTDPRLYALVARLVMDPDVLRQNNNYPFKTSPLHTWHLCLDNGEVAGFMPAKITSSGLSLDNYYLRNDNPDILHCLLNHILSHTTVPVTALAHKRHTCLFAEHGFTVRTELAKYDRMSWMPLAKGGDR